MPNSLYTATQAAQVAANLVADEAPLSALISRNFENDLLGGGGKGRTVFLKIPAALVAHNRDVDDVTNALLMDSITETTVPLTLGTHLYSAVGLSEGDLSMDLSNFASQVLARQTAAIAAHIELSVRGALLAEPYDTSIRWDIANPVKCFTALRKLLRLRGIMEDGLSVVVGTDVYEALLEDNALVDASRSGSTAVLNEAQVDRLRGFNIVEDADIPHGDIIAFASTAYTLATRAPLVPLGARYGATVNAAGFSMRYLRDYSAKETQDRSIVGTFSGVLKMPLYRIVRTADIGVQSDVGYTRGNAAVEAVPNGAVLRMSIGDTEPV